VIGQCRQHGDGSDWGDAVDATVKAQGGDLPSYMAVIVATKVTQEGSLIKGDLPRMVIVKTDGGYDANPGHAGTGVVITAVH